jgi:4-hydroxy-tetrahydrodipicolinate synthase
VAPYYSKPNQEGLFQHYKALDATPLPIIMYNVPSRTGMNVTGETQVRIANECKTYLQPKASGDFASDQLH